MSPTATTGMMFEKSADSLERLILVARHIFAQALEFVELLESDEKLTGDSKYLPGSTIGIVYQQSHLSEIENLIRVPRKTPSTREGPLHAVVGYARIPPSSGGEL